MAKVGRRSFIAAVGSSIAAAAAFRPESWGATQQVSDKAEAGAGIGAGILSEAWPTGDELLQEIMAMPWVSEHFGLQIAYCQHPMYLIIDEDRGVPPVCERIPPWGAPDAATYVERIRRNLSSLEKYPGLHLNYDFAAADIENIEQRFPDVVEEMKRMFNKGLLDFVNGSYSQAHLHTESSEGNWRDFEIGLEVYERLFGKKIAVFACQETGLHEQLPQMLKKMGYEFIVTPLMQWFAEIIGGSFEFTASQSLGTAFMRNNEFLEAQALDGTSLPLYLSNDDEYLPFNASGRKRFLDQDLYGASPLSIYFPDMNEINGELFDKLKSLCSFVILQSALKERLNRSPARAKAILRAHWSYIEGVGAEALMRKNRAAEEAALLAESIQGMAVLQGLPSKSHADIQQIWRTIIKYHNHDVLGAEDTDLRRHAIEQLEQGIKNSERIATEVATKLISPAENEIALVNSIPYERTAVVMVEGDRIPGPGFQSFEGRSIGLCQLPAGGIRSFPISTPSLSQEAALPQKITNEHYTVQLSETGLLRQLTTAKGKEILADTGYVGGEIRALIHDSWADNLQASCKYATGPVCDIVTRTYKLGRVPVTETFLFFRHANAIKCEIEAQFDGDSIGIFWLDETKLNVYFPTKGGDNYHDVPFGYVKGREREPILAPSWVYCGGLGYINRGTVKHWIRDGVIANVIAWGGNYFDNRLHYDGWTERCARMHYDIRLHGTQRIEYWLVPYGDFYGNQMVRDANSLTFPTLGVPGRANKSWYSIEGKNLAVTAAYPKDGKLWIRGYQMPSPDQSPYRNWEIVNKPLTEL